MKPYYEEDGITIYHADCREVLPSISFDVLITDPPYGVAFDGKKTKHTTKTSGGYTIGDDGSVGPWVVNAALAVAKRAIVFPGIRQLFRYPEPTDMGCIYCPSGAGIGKWGFTCFHPILYYGDRPTSALFPTSIQSFATSDIEGHPCPKPLPWLSWAVKMACQPGDIVCDPLSGSGTTLEAAKKAGHAAIGIEIEERYCEVAAKRLSQGVLALEAAV